MLIYSSTGSEVCLNSVRPHCLKPVVELYSVKAAVCELHKGAIAWFLQLQMLQDDMQILQVHLALKNVQNK